MRLAPGGDAEELSKRISHAVSITKKQLPVKRVQEGSYSEGAPRMPAMHPATVRPYAFVLSPLEERWRRSSAAPHSVVPAPTLDELALRIGTINLNVPRYYMECGMDRLTQSNSLKGLVFAVALLSLGQLLGVGQNWTVTSTP